MSLKFNPFTGNFDFTGSSGTDDWDEAGTNILEPSDSARKQIHIGGENDTASVIASTGSIYSAIADGAASGNISESYSSGQFLAPIIIGVRGRGTKASPSGVQDGDLLYSFGSSGITSDGTNGLLLNQFAGFAVEVEGTPTATVIPMAISINTNEGAAIKAYPNRQIMLGSGSTVPTERLGAKGRIELEQQTAPTQRTDWGKIWYDQTDNKLHFMDESGNNYDLTESVSFVSDTKADILATTPATGTYAISTDTDELFFYDGTNWKVHPIKVSTELENPDAGYTQDSDKRGYGDDYIYGKKMYATGIGDFTDTPFEGAIKVDQSVDPPLYQIHLRGRWNTLFYDLTMENGDFEHVPQTYSIDVRSGNSNTTGLNGQPIIREYKVDAGAYPREVIIDGGVL